MLFSADEAVRITGGEAVGIPEGGAVEGVTIDSRAVSPGDLFIALPGEHTDGHRFAGDAVNRGALAAVVSGPRLPAHERWIPRIQVKDPLEALGRLASAYRGRFRVPVVGVTGSVGKTTTKEMIAAVLGRKMKVLKSFGNYNNEIGVPLSVFAWRPEHEAAVFELAMRGMGEIKYLTEMVRPDLGIVTNVGSSHIEVLGSREAIAKAKMELVAGLPAGGTALLNVDDPMVAAMAEAAPGPVVFFGTGPDARIRASRVEQDGSFAFTFTLEVPGGRRRVRVPVPGTHLVTNALAAAAVGRHLGLTLEEIEAGLMAYVPAGSRMQVFTAAGVTVLDDTYNASPASTAAALDVLRQVAGSGRAVAVIADMLELGARSEEEHEKIGVKAARRADLAAGFGPGAAAAVEAARNEGMSRDGARAFSDKEDLLAWLADTVEPGDTVLVKGSRGMAMEEVVARLRRILAARA